MEFKAMTKCAFLACSGMIFNADAQAEKDDAFSLEEVYVTAQRRTTSQQEVPTSVAALTAEKLEVEGVTNLKDLQGLVPNLQINSHPTNSTNLSLYIRGIGEHDPQITKDSPVAVYIDGVYYARSVGLSLEVADIERIEVLRGPQGALYGRNATGGAVTVATRRPSVEAVEFKQKFTFGDREKMSSTLLNVPLGDSLAIKASYLRRDVDGWMSNPTGRGDWGESSTDGGRIDLRWTLSEHLLFDYGFDYTAGGFYNQTYQAITRPTPSGESQDLVRNDAERSIDEGPGYTDQRLERLKSDKPVEESTSRVIGHSASLAWAHENMELKYILAYRELIQNSYPDLSSGGEGYNLNNQRYTAPDGTEYPLVFYHTDQNQWSNEIQITADFLDERLVLIAGGYYMVEDGAEILEPESHVFDGRINGVGNTIAPGSRLVQYAARTAIVENIGWAAYVQATFTPDIWDERLSVTLGGRHSEDDRSVFLRNLKRSVIYGDFQGSPGVQVSLSSFEDSADRKFSNDSIEWAIQFKATDQINTYLKYGEGYRVGGFNTRDPDPDGSNNEFGFGFKDGYDSEVVNAYEIGVKSEFFDRRLRLNANVYSIDYQDRQISFAAGTALGDSKATNAGKASSDGFEVETTWLATRDLMIDVSYAYLDASIDEVIRPSDGADVTNDFVYASAPRHTYNASLNWTAWDPGWSRLMFYVSYSFLDDRKGQVINVEPPKDSSLPSRELWNARVMLADISVGQSSSMTLALWGKNLTDEEYAAVALHQLPQADRAVIWGEPRSYGLDFIYNY